MTTALIDLDPLAFRSAFAAQKVIRQIYVDDDLQASFGTAKARNKWLKAVGLEKGQYVEEEKIESDRQEAAFHYIIQYINNLGEDVTPSKWEFYTEDKEHEDINFRKELYPAYKANRTQPMPVHLDVVYNFVESKFPVDKVAGMEADDALSIRANQLKDFVIVTIDKDLDTVGGWHYNPITRNKYMVTPEAAEHYFYCQILMGDKADNIIGLDGVGPVSADKMLAGCSSSKDMWEVVVREYVKRCRPIHEAVMNAKLLHMLRTSDDVWEPPE